MEINVNVILNQILFIVGNINNMKKIIFLIIVIFIIALKSNSQSLKMEFNTSYSIKNMVVVELLGFTVDKSSFGLGIGLPIFNLGKDYTYDYTIEPYYAQIYGKIKKPTFTLYFYGGTYLFKDLRIELKLGFAEISEYELGKGCIGDSNGDWYINHGYAKPLFLIGTTIKYDISKRLFVLTSIDNINKISVGIGFNIFNKY